MKSASRALKLNGVDFAGNTLVAAWSQSLVHLRMARWHRKIRVKTMCEPAGQKV